MTICEVPSSTGTDTGSYATVLNLLKFSFSLSSSFRLWFAIKLRCLARVDFITVYARDLED